MPTKPGGEARDIVAYQKLPSGVGQMVKSQNSLIGEWFILPNIVFQICNKQGNTEQVEKGFYPFSSRKFDRQNPCAGQFSPSAGGFIVHRYQKMMREERR